jgi:hypothetical protein
MGSKNDEVVEARWGGRALSVAGERRPRRPNYGRSQNGYFTQPCGTAATFSAKRPPPPQCHGAGHTCGSSTGKRWLAAGPSKLAGIATARAGRHPSSASALLSPTTSVPRSPAEPLVLATGPQIGGGSRASCAANTRFKAALTRCWRIPPTVGQCGNDKAQRVTRTVCSGASVGAAPQTLSLWEIMEPRKCGNVGKSQPYLSTLLVVGRVPPEQRLRQHSQLWRIQRRRWLRKQAQCLNDAPCPQCTSHGASIMLQ